jgi:hypothetical protein
MCLVDKGALCFSQEVPAASTRLDQAGSLFAAVKWLWGTIFPSILRQSH